MARIYTRTGDAGETSLGNGTRVPKPHPRVDMYGDVDELNSLLGVAAALLLDRTESVTAGEFDLGTALADIQSRLFDLGTVLANPSLCEDIARGHVDHQVPSFPQGLLEEQIDAMDGRLEPLSNFILPGGTKLSAMLHVARTVCRRLERKCVLQAQEEAIPADAIAWLNRLSDFLFTAARMANAAAGVPDVPWTPAPPESATDADPEED
jgi:cob(I)alamin adenosyltransferase